jgi:predicted hotdog family 3-hydroxylacyl-ACP dehydratase
MSIESLPSPAAAIPHKHDAVLIDEIQHADGNRVTAVATVRPGTAFSDAAGNLPGWVGPEIMAQAVAAFSGCRSLRDRGESAEIGLLLGIRDYESAVAEFCVGDQLQIEVVRSSEDEEGRGVFDGSISIGGAVVAAGTLTVFEPRDGSFLEAERARNE